MHLAERRLRSTRATHNTAWLVQARRYISILCLCLYSPGISLFVSLFLSDAADGWSFQWRFGFMVTATREDSESPCNGHLINRFQIWDRTARTGGSNKQVTDNGGERSILINSSKITYVEPLYGRYMKTRMRIYNCYGSHRGQHLLYL